MSQITSHILDQLSKNIQFNIFCKQSISFNCKWPIFQTHFFCSGINLYWFSSPISSHYIFQNLNSLSNTSPSPLYLCSPSAYRHLLYTELFSCTQPLPMCPFNVTKQKIIFSNTNQLPVTPYQSIKPKLYSSFSSDVSTMVTTQKKSITAIHAISKKNKIKQPFSQS